jgi:hypothetical protein
MEWFVGTLRNSPELEVFLVLGLGALLLTTWGTVIVWLVA